MKWKDRADKEERAMTPYEFFMEASARSLSRTWLVLLSLIALWAILAVLVWKQR